MKNKIQVVALLDQFKATMLSLLEKADPDHLQFSEVLENFSDILDIKDVVEITKAHRCTVYRWIKAGTLASFSSGAKKKVLKKDLINFLCSEEGSNDE